MAKLRSVPLYPTGLVGSNPGLNLVLNKTPEGKFQTKPGGPQEGEFEVLYTGDDEQSALEFARRNDQ